MYIFFSDFKMVVIPKEAWKDSAIKTAIFNNLKKKNYG